MRGQNVMEGPGRPRSYLLSSLKKDTKQILRGLWRAGKMGKETTFIAVALGGVASAVSVYSLQRYYAPHFDKKGEKLSSPGFSFLPKYAYLPSRCLCTFHIANKHEAPLVF